MSMKAAREEYTKQRKAIQGYGAGPCEYCGHPDNKHDFLITEEIEEHRKKGSHVSICEAEGSSVMLEMGIGRLLGWRCYIHAPPEDPCDDDFMEGISA